MKDYRVLIYRKTKNKRQDLFSQGFQAKDETQAARYCDFILGAFCSMSTYECVSIDESIYFEEGDY